MGVYKSQLISVVNIFGTLTGNLPVFAYTMAWYAFAIFTVVTTVLWGRLYCGRICAFGAVTQLIDAIAPRRWQIEIPAVLERRASYIKYGILFTAVGYFLVTREIAFYRYIEPFWMFTFDATPLLWTMLGMLLIASVFVRNLYCRFLCPLGAALGLLSSLTVFKIKRWSECSQCALCEKTCEWGAIRKRKIVKSECVRCDDCEILYDNRSRCPHWLLVLKRKTRAMLG
jgi:polyferredoxin